jgi:hypothetical protein
VGGVPAGDLRVPLPTGADMENARRLAGRQCFGSSEDRRDEDFGCREIGIVLSTPRVDVKGSGQLYYP